MAVNKVILLGNLGKDPIVRKLDNGRAVAQFSIATTEKYKDKAGNPTTNTEWHNIVAWSPLAEIAEKYLKKGNQVYIEGKIASREYTDKEGILRRTTEIVAREMNLVGGPNSGTPNGYAENASSPETSYTSAPSSQSKTAAVPANLVSEAEDDLPF